MTQTTINRDETSIDLIQHVPSGEIYIARFVADHHDDGRCDTRIVDIAGPISRTANLDPDNLPSTWVAYCEDYLANDTDTTEDAEWANAQTWRGLATAAV